VQERATEGVLEGKRRGFSDLALTAFWLGAKICFIDGTSRQPRLWRAFSLIFSGVFQMAITRKKLKFIVGSSLIVVAVGFLIGSGINQTSQYFVTVAELEAQGLPHFYGKGLKVKGSVSPGSIQRNPGNHLDVAFQIQENKSILKVLYTGVTPDMFADGRDVVVEGTLSKDGVFHANTLLTSCPSKYEADKEKGKTHPGPLPNTGGEGDYKKPFTSTATGAAFPKA
jgi:cytochrome c-type biogenesis protein CcmE